MTEYRNDVDFLENSVKDQIFDLCCPTCKGVTHGNYCHRYCMPCTEGKSDLEQAKMTLDFTKRLWSLTWKLVEADGHVKGVNISEFGYSSLQHRYEKLAWKLVLKKTKEKLAEMEAAK